MLKVSPLFKRLHNSEFKKISLLRGGSRSSKTYSLCQMFVIWLLTGKFGTKEYLTDRAYILRKTLPSLKRTVLIDFLDALHSTPYAGHVEYNKTNLVFTYVEKRGKNYHRRSVNFLPADDSEKMKGLNPGLCWLNEADSISYDAFTQVNIRTRHHLIADYNPSNPETWPYTLEKEWLPKRDDMSLDISTYHDNPFLIDSVIREIEILAETDQELYQVYNLGNWAKLTGLIFPVWQEIEEMPESYDAQYYGMDFGYEHPTTLVRVLKSGMSLYIDELFYESGVLNNELSAQLHRHRVGKVHADAADPKGIQELRKLGHSVRAAKKGHDTIRQGINKIKQHYIFITARSINLKLELKRYKWAVDNNGELKRPLVPVDAFNHAIDSVRYALSYIMNRKLKY